MQVANLLDDIERAIETDALALPSLPDVALRIQKLAADPDCTFGSIGKALKRDASVSAGLIRLANSPLYMSRVPATNVRSAVHRIGIPGVRNFVTTVVMKSLFTSSRAELAEVFRRQWHESSEVSALTAVLSTFCAGFDPDDALLAGLLQDIGAVTLLGHLAALGTAPDTETLEDVIDEHSAAVAVRVLEHWKFDERYIEVARARHDWQFDSAGGPALVDIVTVARAHYYKAQGRSVPALETMPSFQKLPLTVSASGTVHSLDQAVEEVGVIRSMLRE